MRFCRDRERVLVSIDHSTIHRWVIKLTRVLEEAFRKRKRKRGIGAVGDSWRLVSRG
jgi:transposase-like protein